jgi:RHS repeat-associated protein
LATTGATVSPNSAFGVRYNNGKLYFTTTDIESFGQSGFGHSRTFTSSGPDINEGFPTCAGWPVNQLKVLYKATDDSFVSIFQGGVAAISFAKNGNTYSPLHFFMESMVYDGPSQELRLISTTGERWVFNDWAAASSPGHLKTYFDPAGNQTTVTRNGSGQITDIQRSSGSITEKWLYTYTTNTDPLLNGLFQDATLQYGSGGSFNTVRKAVYDYYSNAAWDGNGQIGNVRTVKIQDAPGNVLETKYYRYDLQHADGFLPLRYVVEGRSFERLKQAAGGTDALVFAAADSVVGTYAQLHMTYDAYSQVATQTVNGAGCSCSAGANEGTFAYRYTASTVPGYTDGYNNWKVETIEDFKDTTGAVLWTNYVYTNWAGEVMLKVFIDRATGKTWRTYFQYDSAGRLITEALPSAVIGHDVRTLGLVSSSDIKANDGLIFTYTYGTSTTATPMTPGDVQGYLKRVASKKGNDDTSPDTKSLAEYLAHTDANNITVHPIGRWTVYRNTDNGVPLATHFSYTWQGTSNQVSQKTTTYPPVPTSQNGPGGSTGDQEFAVFDGYNRLSWSKDGEGAIQYREYDAKTGARTRSIIDVNTDNASDFLNLPPGWSSPNGVHLKTDYRVDDLGRPTRLIDPKGNVTYIVYKDAEHALRVYPGWDTDTSRPTGPTLVRQQVWNLSFNDSVATSATPALTDSEPNGTESIGTAIEQWTRWFLDTGDREAKHRAYFNPTGLTYSNTTSDIGVVNLNYYETVLGYDQFGLHDRIKDGAGTIHREIHDTRHRVTSSWIGTNDTPPSGEWSPSNNVPPANMLKTRELQYDHVTSPVPGVGDDTLTQIKVYSTDSTFYITELRYDWLDRLLTRRGPDGVATTRTYDNLDRVTVEDTFADINANVTLDPGEQRAKVEYAYDDKGQFYQSSFYEVTGGVVLSKLITNHWHNHRYQVIKTQSPNRLLSKNAFDGAGRLKATYTSQDDDETAYADAFNVTGDKVIEQVKYFYDKANNLVSSTTFKRPDNDTTTTGELVATETLPQVFIQALVNWFDKANRTTHSANYGRDNGSTRYVWDTAGKLIDVNGNGIPDEAEGTPKEPNSSENYLVVRTLYDKSGFPYRSIDNLGRINETTFDREGRVLKVVENYVDGIPGTTKLDTDRTVEFLRGAGGRLETLRAFNPKGASIDQEETKYLYESAINATWPSNIIYPDSPDTNSSGTDQRKIVYDRLGRTATESDQRGTVHTYNFDSSGRFLSDAITIAGTGVDTSILRINYSYDDLSRPTQVTSYNAASGGSAVNDVKFSYNEMFVIWKSEQAHSGAVGTGTPAVTYGYTDGVSSGIAKYIRLSSVSYPGGGRTVYFRYPPSGMMGDRLNRVDNLAEDSSSSVKYVSYAYLGENTVAKVIYAGVAGGLDLDYRTGGNWSAWDRFGRIVNQEWVNTASNYWHDRYRYTYDRNSNPLSRKLDASTLPGTPRDEYYVPDGLNRLKKQNRGALDGNHQILDANANYTISWDELEAVGNWRKTTTDNNGGAAGGAITQIRTFNKANEILTVTGDSPAWAAPAWDPAGNMQSGPMPGNESVRLHFTFDAWNRLVVVKNDNGGLPGTILATYTYDGLGRRIQKVTGGNTYDYYYNELWQLLEVRKNGSANPYEHYIWDIRYIDACAIRFRDANENGTFEASEKHYYTQDANFNTTSLVDSAGTVVERYAYDPYGKVHIFDSNWNSRVSSSFGQEVLFGGYRRDPETGICLARYRNYHPPLGVWLQRDPAGYAGGMNLYEYVSSNSLRFFDPWGLQDTSFVDKTVDKLKELEKAGKIPTPVQQQEAWARKLPFDPGVPHVYPPTVKKLIDDMTHDILTHPDTPTVGSKVGLIQALLEQRNQDFKNDLHNEQLYTCFSTLRVILKMGGATAIAGTTQALNSTLDSNPATSSIPGRSKSVAGKGRKIGSVGAAGRKTKSLTDAARTLGKNLEDVRKAVHKVKADGKLQGNPDVEIDVTNGDVYVEGTVDPIGNIVDEIAQGLD